MPSKEPRNPFYLFLLLTGVLFAVTAVAYAVVPWVEQNAIAAGNPPPPSPLRDALRTEGWKWLLFELIALVIFGLLSMALDRLRSLKQARAQATMPTGNDQSSVN